MDDIAINVDSVSKTFKLPHEKSGSIKSLFLNMFRGKRTYEMQQALNNVSFEVKKGEFFGIVGRNGSGKSTLLKLISGIYSPDKGAITVNGKLTPFIELGVGFNPELTGRDNVFLNGSLLGFSRKEMEKIYDEIVEFAELERFMDQKLKNYSSGMQVRLAFSIAIQANTDILVLDEVLAVGDSAFQKKCFDYFDTIKSQKKVVVLVTHDMSVVEKYCTKAILLDKGKIKSKGSPQSISSQYGAINREAYLASKLESESRKNVTNIQNQIKIRLIDASGKANRVFKTGDIAKMTIKWANPSVRNLGIALHKQSGEYIFGANTINDAFKIRNRETVYTVKLDVGSGDYIFKVALFGENDEEIIDFIDDGPSFTVDPINEQKWGGIVELKREWSTHV